MLFFICSSQTDGTWKYITQTLTPLLFFLQFFCEKSSCQNYWLDNLDYQKLLMSHSHLMNTNVFTFYPEYSNIYYSINKDYDTFGQTESVKKQVIKICLCLLFRDWFLQFHSLDQHRTEGISDNKAAQQNEIPFSTLKKSYKLANGNDLQSFSVNTVVHGAKCAID